MLGAIKDLIAGEPVLTLALVQATLALLVGFGLHWTAEQISLVMAFTAALLGFIARSKVTPA